MAEGYGILAEFKTPEDLLAAARRAREEGYRDLDAFTPFPVHGLAEVLDIRDSRVLWLGLGGGIFGFLIAVGMQVFASWDYPIDVGGRPVFALSAFAVIAFELTVLFAALTPAIGMLVINGLPRLNYPVFSAARFKRASKDRFFLCIKDGDAKFDVEKATAFLESTGAETVERVTA
jgi:hypothetical protein